MSPLRSLRGALLLALAAFALTFAASSCGGGGTNQGWYPGQTDFTNNEPGGYSPVPGYANGAEDKRTAPGGSDTASPAPPAGPPQGRTGTVEEADIYKVDQNRLFYLNTYRGFIIYDLADPKKPQLLSRLPVYGYPIEMFIQKNTVYALIRDALYLTQAASGKLEFSRHNVSQLVAIDITDLKSPRVLQTVDIIGELREGVSRKIADTVYVVSYRDQSYWNGWGYFYSGPEKEKEQAWVYAFNVADPKNLKLVDQLKVFEGGSFSYHDPNYNTSVSRYFSGVTISATSNALMVAESWNTYGYVSGSKYNCGSSFSQEQAMVSIIDISDPYGKIRLHTKFETYGVLGDQFKQTYIFDDKTQKGTYLGILARREWSSSNCQGQSVTQNTLESWDITDGGAPKKVHELAFGKPGETVRGSVFDTDRAVAFAITARNVDPLYAISFADPTNLKILSAIDGLSGDMSVFRFIADNKFLLAIGRDTTSTCTGFGSPTTGWATGVAVSIIDVQDLAKIRLVQRQCVAVKNASWVSSELTWNLDQAHKMIGMFSDGKVNAITVPVYYYKKTGADDWYWYGYETAVGLMTWDLTKYDPTKSELEQNVLTNFGTIIHPKGQVRRSIIFNHQTDVARRMVLNLSNTHLSLVDIGDLANPVMQSMVEVAPYQDQLYRFGSYVVEHIRPAQYDYFGYASSTGENASEFRVVPVGGGGKLEDTQPVATFTVGQVERVLKYKDNLVLFRRVYSKDPSKPYYYGWEAELVVYSLATPTAPVKMGTLKLPGPIFPYYWYWCGLDAYWGGYWFDSYGSNNFVVTDRGLSFLTNLYTYDAATQKSAYSRQLMFVDLTNVSAPALKQITLSSADTWTFFSLIPDPSDSQSFFLSYRTKVGQISIDGTPFWQHKYYAQRWAWNPSSSDWVSDYAVNVPGQLMRTWTSNGTRLFLTYDYTYQKMPSPGNSQYTSWQHSFRLNLLRQITPWGAPAAELLDFFNFQSFYLKDVVVDQNKLYVNARRDYYYNQTNSIPWQDVSDQLMIFDLSGLKLTKKYAEPTGTYQVRLMGTYQGKLFVNIPGDGILVVDVSDPAKPNGLQFARTLGYTTHIEFVGDRALLSSGYFGIYEIDLKAAAAIPNTPNT